MPDSTAQEDTIVLLNIHNLLMLLHHPIQPDAAHDAEHKRGQAWIRAAEQLETTTPTFMVVELFNNPVSCEQLC